MNMRKRTRIAALLLAPLLFGFCTSCENQAPAPAGNGSSDRETEPPASDPSVENAERKGYLIVTDYLSADETECCGETINRLIADNPNRTIFFPDRVYLLETSILTPAAPEKSVDLQLSNYAVLRAAGDWECGGAVVKLGATEPANDTRTPGSNYSMTGGIVDGSGIADGVAIMGGRETRVSQVSIKNVHTGLYIAFGANSGSSDADISDLSITGCREKQDVGILLEGYDNTITNVRISGVHVGVHLKSGGNMLRNVHPLYVSDYEYYKQSVGFLNENGTNFYDYCYSDQFHTGFRTCTDSVSMFTNCFVFWYSDQGGEAVAFRADSLFNSSVNGLVIGFKEKTENTVLSLGGSGGSGVLRDIAVNKFIIQKGPYKDFLQGELLRYGY